LHLTGQSGSGKSSLITAYLTPKLRSLETGKTILLTVRSHDDPLVSLKEALLPLWKGEPKNYDALTPFEALHVRPTNSKAKTNY
jgi:hypothetical protein